MLLGSLAWRSSVPQNHDADVCDTQRGRVRVGGSMRWMGGSAASAAIIEELRECVVTKSLHVDNAAAISIGGSSNNIHWRTRHLRVRAAAMHKAVEEKWLHLLKVPGRR